MLDLKPYGAFIENTIRPLIEEVKWLLEELEKRGLKLDGLALQVLLKKVGQQHFQTVLIQSLTQILVTLVVVGAVVWITVGSR